MYKRHFYFTLIIIFQILVFSAPYIYGVFFENNDYVFTGNVGVTNETNDTQCANCFYLTMGFKQSYDGAWVIEDKFQGFDTYPKIIHPWWIIGGHLSRLTGVNILAFNVIQRLLWIIISSWVVYRFSLQLFRRRIYALFTLLLFNFSSFLLFPTPEGSVYVANLAAVVLPMAYLSLAALFFLLYRYIHHKKVLVALSIVTFILVIDYPYTILTFSASIFIFFLYLFFTKQKNIYELSRQYAIIFAPAYLVVAYDFLLIITDPRLVGSQAHVQSASLKELLLGYLPFTLFSGMFAIKLLFKRNDIQYKNFWIYLYIFASCSFIMTQVPTSILAFSMQMIVGVQLPLILTTIEFIRKYMYRRYRVVTLITIMVISTIPSIQFYNTILHTIQHHKIPSYIDRDIYNGINWIDQHASKQAQTLCMPHWSSYVGIFSGTRLYIGGDILFTPDFDNRLKKMVEIIGGNSLDEFKLFLAEERIDYIFYDQKMREIDIHGLIPKLIAHAEYSNEMVDIYRVSYEVLLN